MLKLPSALILLSAVTVIGCQNTTLTDKQQPNRVNPTNTHMTANVDTKMSPQKVMSIQKVNNIKINSLTDYDWQLLSATDSKGQPVTLLNSMREKATFKIFPNTTSHIGDSIYFSVGCNSMQSNFELKNNTLSTGMITATEMFCAEDLNAAERLMANAMGGNSQLSLTDNATSQTQPILTQITQDNMTLVWQGQQTPESRYNQVGETVFWEIDNVQPLCPDGKANTCLNVRPVYYNEQGIKEGVGNWDIFVDKIEGYTHDSGYKQIVRLKRFVTDPIDVKGKQFVYVLDTVVESSVVE